MADHNAEERINNISEELLLVLEGTHQLSKEEAAEAAALALNKMKSGNYLVATVHLAPSVECWAKQYMKTSEFKGIP